MIMTNLKIGMVCKNYKELCNILGDKIKTGGAKNNQLKEWEQYFIWKKEGKAYIIIDIINTTVELKKNESNNKVDYINDMYLLLLNHLANCHSEKVFISKLFLLKTLNMINQRYNVYKYLTNIMSEQHNIPEEDIINYFEHSNSLLKRHLASAIKMFTNKSLAQAHEIFVIVFTNDDSKYDGEHKPATDKQTKFILSLENFAMKELGYKSKQEIVKHGDWDTFAKRVLSNLQSSDGNILYYYKAYQFLFSKKNIIEENYLISTPTHLRQLNSLNKHVYRRLSNNAKKRYEKNPLRYDKDYIKNHKTFLDLVIKNSN